jgi:hypothetical protein
MDGDHSPAKLLLVRRSLASVLLFLASVALGIAVTGWWVQRTVFAPTSTERLASVVLEDSAIRDEVVGHITDSVAAQLGQDPAALAPVVDAGAATAEGTALLVGVVVDAHAHLIGASDDPVVIEPADLAGVLGIEQAVGLSAFELPVPQIRLLAQVHDALDTLVPGAAIAAAVLAALGMLAHPDKRSMLRSIGWGLLAVAALVGVLGWVVPSRVVPELSDSAWARAPGDLARDSAGLLAGIGLVAFGAGLLFLLAASRSRRPLRR